MRRNNAEWSVVYESHRLRPSSAARILSDERTGIWYATPSDGPLARDIKTELREGLSRQKATLRVALRAEAAWKSKPQVALE
jgi:hypothetical protein